MDQFGSVMLDSLLKKMKEIQRELWTKFLILKSSCQKMMTLGVKLNLFVVFQVTIRKLKQESINFDFSFFSNLFQVKRVLDDC
jgi:hypothetical protein